MSYIVTYDLHKHGQNYTCLSDKLKKYGTYFHIQGSVWIIETADSAVQIRNNLKACLDSNDKLFVGKLTGDAAWHGYSKSDADWLQKNL